MNKVNLLYISFKDGKKTLIGYKILILKAMGSKQLQLTNPINLNIKYLYFI